MSSHTESNLLVVAQSYANFVKDQVESIAPYFNKVYVLPVYRPIAEISNFIPLDGLKPFRKKVKIDLSDLPENVTVIPTPLNYIPFKSWYKVVGDKHLKTVLKIIEKHQIQFNLIHCHFTYSSGYVGANLKEKYNVPLVITGHGFDIYDLPFRSEYWKDKIENVLKSADRIITVSKKNIEFIGKIGVNEHVELIPNGYKKTIFFPLKKVEARKKINVSSEKKIIVTVGNLIPIKGQKYLVDAMARLVTQHDNLLCLIIGGGALRKELKEQIKRLHLQEHVKLVGEVEHSKVHQWINASDLFVLPSMNEGNPTVLFECLACGRPFIGSAVGGVPEIIQDKRLGLLFQPGDVDDMEKTIHQALITDWEQNFITYYSQSYTWDAIAKRIILVYKQLITFVG